MTDDEQPNESEDELRRRANESFSTGAEALLRGDYSEALSSCENALALYRGVPGSECDQACCLYNSGVALMRLGDWWGALERFDRALALYRELPEIDRDQVRFLYNSGIDNSGIMLMRLGDWRGALERFDRALALYRELPGTERKQADCLHNSGVALTGLGDWRGALERFDRALTLYRGVPGTERDQAGCLYSSGPVLDRLGDWRSALERFDRALTLFRGVSGSERDQAGCLYSSGIVLGKLGDWRGALERFDRALTLYRGVPGSERDQAGCLYSSGPVLDRLGDWRGALGRFDRALTLFRGVSGSERDQADCLHNSGIVLGKLGDWRGALKRFERALALLDQHTPEADRIEAERTGARCVQGIGACLVNLNEAVFPNHFTRALEVFRRPEHVDHTKDDQASCLRLIGNCRSATGDLNGAVDAYQQAQDLYRQVGQPERATDINVPLARVLKRKAAAIDSIFERCALLEESLNLTIEAALYLDRSRFRLDRLDDRQRWFQAHAQSTMDLALDVAAELDRPHLISDLIATWRTVGTLDVPRTGPSRTASGENLTSDQSVTATGHFTGANSAKEMSEEDEGSSFVAGPAVGSQTAIIAHLPRRPGPGLLMPHHRTALAGYDQAPARTAAYR